MNIENIISSKLRRLKAVSRGRSGKRVVRVPRAGRAARPVYVGMDPKSGTYRRNHEGDYHCSLEEMSLMFRDASFVTQDAKVFDNMDMTVFCMETVKRYRNFFRSTHINHLWNNEDDEMSAC